MVSRHIFLSCLISLCALPAYSADNQKETGQLHHRLIILSDNSEHVGKPVGALTGTLLGALQSAESPILVSVSLWQNLVEKAGSLISGAQLEEKEEKFAFDCARTIGSMLNSDENSIESIGLTDPVMAKQIVVDRINAALEVLKKEDVKNPKLSERVIDYLRCFQMEFSTNKCDVYKVNSFYYLVVPKEYKNSCVESSLGLAVNNFELVTDPLAIDWMHFNTVEESECHLLNALGNLFLSSKDSDVSCVWDIYLCGHGRNSEWLQKNCPERSIIADMTPAEFKDLLHFFENDISTNSFWYTTCEGGGMHAQDILVGSNDNGGRSFPIVCLCLTDTSSYGYLPGVVDSLSKGVFSAKDIELDVETGKWKLVFNSKHEWNKFFSAIEDNSFNGNELEWIWNASKAIVPTLVENTPLLLRAHSKDIITIHAHNCLRVSQEYCEYLDSVSRDIVVDVEHTSFVFLDQLKLDLPYTITSKEVPLLVSVAPGKAIHHLTKIGAKESYVEQFVKMFKPLKGISFDKIFVVDEIVCKVDKEKKYRPLLQADNDELITLQDVVITHKRDQLTRFFFKNVAGDLFKVHMTCSTSCKGACLHGFKKIEDEKVKEAYDLYRNKLISG